MATSIWTGASGRRYEYQVYSKNTTFRAVGGNYIFARPLSTGGYRGLYVGQTSNLAARITPDHHKWACGELHGMSQVHVRLNASEASRLAEERDLLARMSPVCND